MFLMRCAWLLSHTQGRSVSYDESCHTYSVTHMNTHACSWEAHVKRVTQHRMSHKISVWVLEIEWVMCLAWVKEIERVTEHLSDTHQGVVSHMMGHATQTDGSMCTRAWVMWHTWQSQVTRVNYCTHMNESCRTREWRTHVTIRHVAHI